MTEDGFKAFPHGFVNEVYLFDLSTTPCISDWHQCPYCGSTLKYGTSTHSRNTGGWGWCMYECRVEIAAVSEGNAASVYGIFKPQVRCTTNLATC